jgi:hypothetical protein
MWLMFDSDVEVNTAPGASAGLRQGIVASRGPGGGQG